ncbi:MAG: NAD(P)H-dependent oxidoreductase [Coriobacteriales bacterium]|jgi:chromate reductase|nr:NAD(P)H-dependent oxidoreductase [Coriobacteriales bacterium]
MTETISATQAPATAPPVPASKTVGILLGSFRAKAFTRSVANAAAASLPAGYEARVLELDKLPLFDQGYDDEGVTPREWQAFRADVAALDALLIVTPEHNRSFPAVLKNALDIASRPAGQSVWGGKPAAVISSSPGRIGGALANQHIRQALTFLNIHVMQTPELYISDVATLVDAEGVLVDESTLRHIGKFIDAFIVWIERLS